MTKIKYLSIKSEKEKNVILGRKKEGTINTRSTLTQNLLYHKKHTQKKKTKKNVPLNAFKLGFEMFKATIKLPLRKKERQKKAS